MRKLMLTAFAVVAMASSACAQDDYEHLNVAYSRMSPDQFFEQFAKGVDVIRVDRMDDFTRKSYQSIVARFGMTGNDATRDEFRMAMARLRDLAQAKQVGLLYSGPEKKGILGPGADPRQYDEVFRSRDRDGSSLIESREMTEALQQQLPYYDTNRDGHLDVDEFRRYLSVRFGSAAPGDGQGDGGSPEKPREVERPRPVIFRGGALPPDFPFAEIDARGDNDGQVGLYEWKLAGKKTSEFRTIDLNGDGFITVEEFYRFRKLSQADAPTTDADTADPSRTRDERERRRR